MEPRVMLACCANWLQSRDRQGAVASVLLLLFATTAAAQSNRPLIYDVRSYGATGAGQAPDTAAINRAVQAAHDAGGGTVFFPAGTYLSATIHLQSNVTLNLDAGAVLKASADPEAYDAAEPNQWSQYQDFGHSHWHNSLMWGDGIENVAITGFGRIDGSALTREADQRIGNKVIALKLSRNITIRDLSMLRCGHFCILATAVDNLTVDNVRIDTNRDGINIDACRNVRVSNVSVNSPRDDAIVLKSSYGFGFARDTTNVTITNCLVSGYDIGTLLDGTYQRNAEGRWEREPTGRIKLGTESSGGFKNIAVSNCVFENSRGLALETVDGGSLEDVTISNITMRDVVNSPIFVRLGRRLRSPEGTPVGRVRRVTISDINVFNADPKSASLIMGIPGHPIEDVKLHHIRIQYQGGGTKAQADIVPPEDETGYPEPSRFRGMPAYGFFIRHAEGIELNDVDIGFEKNDQRPPFVLQDVKHASFNNVKAQHDGPVFVLKDVDDFQTWHSTVPDTALPSAPSKTL